jgi:hypothetical protein
MSEAQNFPRAEMRGEKNYPLTARLRLVNVFYVVSIVLDISAETFSSRVRKTAELTELTTEAKEGTAEETRAVTLFHFRESQFEVAHSRATKIAGQRIRGTPDAATRRDGQRARQRAES